MKRLLIQTQLSNYDTKGKFILECDSGWQMVMGRVREMQKLNPELIIDVMGPRLWDSLDVSYTQVITKPKDVNPDMDWNYLQGFVHPEDETYGKLNYVQHEIIPNALATRYDFDFEKLGKLLQLHNHKAHPQLKYDAVYINDPMHLRNFKALFMLKAGYKPKFFTHSHFIDNPECPKFPEEASLWLGQVEAAIKSDFNFWQCESSMHVFFESMRKQFRDEVVDAVKAKSLPWDDGYSQAEINLPLNPKNLRFTEEEWKAKTQGKVVIFVPNRIGGKGRSSDYTNCGKFMFELLPKLREAKQNFVVVCGNPSQKIFNHELEEWCGKDGYVSLVPDAFNRDEFKFVAKRSHIALGLYDQDTYGGTVARELVELGCMPLWLDVNEYSSIAGEAHGYPYVIMPDWSDFVETACQLIDRCEHQVPGSDRWLTALRAVVRNRCSYEATTPLAMQKMGLHAGGL